MLQEREGSCRVLLLPPPALARQGQGSLHPGSGGGLKGTVRVCWRCVFSLWAWSWVWEPFPEDAWPGMESSSLGGCVGGGELRGWGGFAA